ncbi:ABC transporter ATP-binding protein [Mesorhizobium sp. M8A.F.Ca.ET.173.01.1.1]|nr:ABC transporter ATP-binding protein [Mesorhizobium sp. M8A.F.Ca.ET.182.01.1.1]TGS78383.1 ABC transporter ATP-binding protein [Mesorhizobium sp. M8A.F.Ca.ET.181.01.1.1]TGV15553.1 ABC transporter ATP-binding protein [Mesorhizobium sp. M8A.F.Ca.ET.173.01.1.1]
MSQKPLIAVEEVEKSFGGLKAINGASFNIDKGSITGLIGPNGAGKTTMFNTIAGLYRPQAGRILLEGEDVSGLPPHALFAKGVVRTFQIAHEFPTLSVLENFMVVPAQQFGERIIDTWIGRRRIRAQEAELRQRALEVIDFLGLTRLRDKPAGNLSGGQKKLVELGRTMMTDARVVLLDEVGAGVNRTLLVSIEDAIRRLNEERGYTFCMIEHDMGFISRLCGRVIVMAEGRVLTQGTAQQVMDDPAVIESYLGAPVSRPAA